MDKQTAINVLQGHFGPVDQGLHVLNVELDPDGIWIGEVWEGLREVACITVDFDGATTPYVDWFPQQPTRSK